VHRFGGVFTFCFFKGQILILLVLAVTLARAARDFFKRISAFWHLKTQNVARPQGLYPLPLGWIKMGSQLSKYWKTY
jgi:hypothetical protein